MMVNEGKVGMYSMALVQSNFSTHRKLLYESRMLVESQTGKVILNCLLKNAELVLDDQNTQNFELM
jgi:hypothetical protein